MKIIKLLSTNAVIFTGDDLTLNAVAAGGNGWTATQFNTQNAVLETIPGALPDGYIGSSWTYTGGVWAVLPSAQEAVTQLLAETLAGKKAAAWERIKAKRDNLGSTGGYKVGDKWFHSTVESRIQNLGLIAIGANVPADLDWKTMDGSFIQMTPALAGQVFAAAVAQDLALFAAGEAHRAAMEAAADPSVYDFSGDWPVAFGG